MARRMRGTRGKAGGIYPDGDCRNRRSSGKLIIYTIAQEIYSRCASKMFCIYLYMLNGFNSRAREMFSARASAEFQFDIGAAIGTRWNISDDLGRGHFALELAILFVLRRRMEFSWEYETSRFCGAC